MYIWSCRCPSTHVEVKEPSVKPTEISLKLPRTLRAQQQALETQSTQQTLSKFVFVFVFFCKETETQFKKIIIGTSKMQKAATPTSILISWREVIHSGRVPELSI